MLHGRIVQLCLFVRAFQLENDGAQPVIAAADGHAGLPYPVPVVENVVAGPVSQGEHILVNGLPGFVAEVFRLGVIGMEDLSCLHHGAGTESLCSVFFGEFRVEGGLQYGDFYSFHGKAPRS